MYAMTIRGRSVKDLSTIVKSVGSYRLNLKKIQEKAYMTKENDLLLIKTIIDPQTRVLNYFWK